MKIFTTKQLSCLQTEISCFLKKVPNWLSIFIFESVIYRNFF
ncbi:hypothetical protein COO91_04482 [Nostoc flagelliforme CCNUN1]|uniref:Uncharacterized protein n=1 Tax=Nostoc flagelliforme CCNUN1 TaxID=2038116 RepID=A0A2K8SSR4_9NOSO|nr:hypothetical protein COO91_04482 [Nostoc flagelliforme CCNUN1]